MHVDHQYLFAAVRDESTEKRTQRKKKKKSQLTFDLLGYNAGVVVEVSHHFVKHATVWPVAVGQVSVLTQVDGVAAGNFCCVCVCVLGVNGHVGREREREKETKSQQSGSRTDPPASRHQHAVSLTASTTEFNCNRDNKTSGRKAFRGKLSQSCKLLRLLKISRMS